MSQTAGRSGVSAVAALLDRLVAQFEGPYDFLRELVQNALDAGSDRAEVALDVHPGEEADPDEVVFELRVVDAGAGMDEAIIDGGLTRLFASTKADDRTMAGGFGIGFVSVFAWQPDAVVVQTGRAGEAWELTFYPDRRFDKRPLAEPFEGTTVTLLRRGRAPERAQIAEAVRDSLWRWCRFCRLELSFEDVSSGEGPELIQDAPAPPGSLAVVEAQADSAIHVAFAVPPEAVLLRRGLVLSQGTAADLLADLQPPLGPTLEHLQVWADSPNLRTTMARDKVVDDPGRAAVLGKIAQAIAGLRERLVERTAEAAAEPGPWTRARHDHYAYLHAHLARERGHLGARLEGRALLRDLAGAAVSLAQLQALARPVLWAPLASGEAAPDRLLAAAAAAGVPVLAAETGDLEWLRRLVEGTGLVLAELGRSCALVREAAGEAESLRATVEAGLTAAGAPVRLHVAAAEGEAGPRGGVGIELGRGAGGVLVLWTGQPVAAATWRTAPLWLDAGEPLLRAAAKSHAGEPRAASRGLALAVRAQLIEAPTPERVAEAIDAAVTGVKN
ncbi:ATP-binding protein [Nannocystis sp. SCPEA4]|uniref:ATP-binding protein n=1 Tax=Nannocystis sp. SCPEA4 TaxID=2996787 RepID=UPI00226FC1A4|nr:ATP-binding protein [Nannocystis sp. SCPEA4]MCY1061291.1 ATP-binding protein [Nannocystis sp. SCPEA4]